MSRNVLRLFFLSCIIISSACAPRTIAPPTVSGGEMRAAISEKKGFTEIESAFAISFEKGESEMRGDGALNISKSGDLDLRVYSFGFPALEVTVSDGLAKSNPRIDHNKTRILTEGLRDCIFWWNSEQYSLDEDKDAYIMRSGRRKVWIDRKSFLPLRQVVSIDDGSELTITYGEPARQNGIWYQSRLRIEYMKSAVTLSVKTLSVNPKNPSCIYCSL